MVFDLDESRKLVINPHEAEAVKLIFEMYVNGYGYSKIIDVLNSHGYKTKKDRISGKIRSMRFLEMKNIRVLMYSIMLL